MTKENDAELMIIMQNAINWFDGFSPGPLPSWYIDAKEIIRRVHSDGEQRKSMGRRGA